MIVELNHLPAYSFLCVLYCFLIFIAMFFVFEFIVALVDFQLGMKFWKMVEIFVAGLRW